MSKTPPTKTKPKLLWIGWDAADWKVITPLLDAGKMPVLESLIDRGVMGNLATLQPVLSPLLWNAMATGKHADKHGILGFVEPRPDGQGIRPVSSTSRRCKALWDMLADEGRRASVVSWWASHPAEKTNGVIVSDLVQHSNSKDFDSWVLPDGCVYPESERDTIAELRLHPTEISAEQVQTMVPKADQVDQENDRRLGTVAKLLSDFGTTHAIGTHLAENEDWDMLAVYYDSIDHFGHAFMKYRPPLAPKISEKDCEIYGELVDNSYRLHDLALARYLELCGPDTTIVIVSDHGFHSDALRPLAGTIMEGEGQAHQHRNFGIFLAAGPGIKKDERIYGATLLDVGPTLLQILGLPIGRDMDGRVLTQIFEDEVEPEYIDSWEERGSPRVIPTQEMDPWAAEAAMDQLVELGYIEAPGEKQQEAIARTAAQRFANLGTIYLEKNEYGKAAKAFEEVGKYQSFSSAKARLAHCYLKMRETQKSHEIVEELLSEKPDSLFVNLTKGELLLLDDREDEALACFKKVELEGLAMPRLQLNLGKIYMRQKRWEEGERIFRKALEEDPDNAMANYSLGVALTYQGKFAEAIEALMTSVGLLHHQPHAHFALSRALAAVGRLPWAARACEIAIELNPNYKKAHLFLAKVFRKQGRPESADKHEAAAHEIDEAYHQKRYEAETLLEDEASGSMEELFERAAAQAEALKASKSGIDASQTPSEECVVIVSGLPRSGTSMMMQMLDAAGLPLLVDDVRASDENNPKGYYEFEPVKKTQQDTAWLEEAKGKVVKVVAPLLGNLPKDRAYKILFMDRAMDEVLASQTSMLDRLGKDATKRDPEKLHKAFSAKLEDTKRWLGANSEFDVLYIDYRSAVENPSNVAEGVASFLGGELDSARMAKAVDAKLYRERSSQA